MLKEISELMISFCGTAKAPMMFGTWRNDIGFTYTSSVLIVYLYRASSHSIFLENGICVCMRKMHLDSLFFLWSRFMVIFGSILINPKLVKIFLITSLINISQVWGRTISMDSSWVPARIFTKSTLEFQGSFKDWLICGLIIVWLRNFSRQDWNLHDGLFFNMELLEFELKNYFIITISIFQIIENKDPTTDYTVLRKGERL